MKVTPLAEQQICEILALGDNTALRVGIAGAGCAGMKYEFSMDSPQENDIVIDLADGAFQVVVDPISMNYLNEAVLDFSADPFNKTFILQNPNAKTTCGCGSSFGV